MAGQLGKGGRRRSVNAFAGFDPDTPLYLAFYFDKRTDNTSITTVLDDEATLDDLKDWEVGGSAGTWTNGYQRKRIDNLIGGAIGGADSSSEDSGSGYHESTNQNEITCFTWSSGSLSQTVGAGTHEIAYFVITTQETGNSSDTDDIIAFGDLTTPITSLNPGDAVKIAAGNADFRQS